jgi:hypothetical protein
VYLRKENKGRKRVCMMKEDTKEGNAEGSNERNDGLHIQPFTINDVLI